MNGFEEFCAITATKHLKSIMSSYLLVRNKVRFFIGVDD